MDDLLQKLEKMHTLSKDALDKERYILFFGNVPITVTKYQIQQLISRSYGLTKDNRYLMFDDGLLTKELLRAKNKLKEGKSYE